MTDRWLGCVPASSIVLETPGVGGSVGVTNLRVLGPATASSQSLISFSVGWTLSPMG